MSKAITIRISDIDLDASPQVREATDQSTVDRYADLIRDGVEMHPVMLVRVGPNRFLVFDGHHRVRSAMAAGHTTVQAVVHDGTPEDATWLAPQANVTHGLPLTREGKRRAVLAILSHSRSAGMGDREIARLTATSHPFVAKLRIEAEEESGQFFKPGFVYSCRDAGGEVLMVRDLVEGEESPFRIVAKSRGFGTDRGVWVYNPHWPTHRKLVTAAMRDFGFKRESKWTIESPEEALPFNGDNPPDPELLEQLGPPGKISSDLFLRQIDALIEEAGRSGGNVTTAGGAA